LADLNTARADVDLGAIRHNLSHASSLAPGARTMAVVKANAYGHGAIEVAAALPADAFAVARVQEAIALRESGIDRRIVLLEGVIDRVEADAASEYRLEITVHDLAMLDRLSPAHRVWLKLDSGMNRLGLDEDAFERAAARLPPAAIVGAMTHFARADEPGHEMTSQQLARFLAVTRDAAWPRSAANSAAILAHPATHLDWIRPGHMLYGGSPFGAPHAMLRPAMTFSAPVIAVRDIRAGDTVGYGAQYRADSVGTVAVVAVGYADGYPREITPDAMVHVGGRRCPVVGRVSMDMIVVRVDDAPVAVGDRVELWGPRVPIDEVARWAGTISYTLMCGVTARVPRRFHDDPDGGADAAAARTHPAARPGASVRETTGTATGTRTGTGTDTDTDTDDD